MRRVLVTGMSGLDRSQLFEHGLAVQGAEIEALAGRIYDRWAPTMAALGGKLAPAGGQ